LVKNNAGFREKARVGRKDNNRRKNGEKVGESGDGNKDLMGRETGK
jgi:hypothetical protein